MATACDDMTVRLFKANDRNTEYRAFRTQRAPVDVGFEADACVVALLKGAIGPRRMRRTFMADACAMNDSFLPFLHTLRIHAINQSIAWAAGVHACHSTTTEPAAL